MVDVGSTHEWILGHHVRRFSIRPTSTIRLREISPSRTSVRVKRQSRLPVGIKAIAALSVILFVVPLLALVIRAPWSRLGSILGSEVVVDALRISALSSIAATALATLLGVPLAAILARGGFRGRSLVRALVTLPIVLPPVVGGAALLFAFGRRGVVGEPLYDATGLVLPFSLWGSSWPTPSLRSPFS